MWPSSNSIFWAFFIDLVRRPSLQLKSLCHVVILDMASVLTDDVKMVSLTMTCVVLRTGLSELEIFKNNSLINVTEHFLASLPYSTFNGWTAGELKLPAEGVPAQLFEWPIGGTTVGAVRRHEDGSELVRQSASLEYLLLFRSCHREVSGKYTHSDPVSASHIYNRPYDSVTDHVIVTSTTDHMTV